jgi:peptidoglycan/LPS O-acetylase OafA/YrhL
VAEAGVEDGTGPSKIAQSVPVVSASAAYVPGLDGLRAVAVVLVFLFHARVPGFGAGFFGVDLFFVLSGYLITDLLMAEIARSGRVDVLRFLSRRSLRLLPALVMMLVAFVALAPLFPEVPDRPALQALLAFAYVADYSFVLIGLPDEIGHTWSLAVEAKFYLVWPLILLLVLRKVRPTEVWKVIALLALVATVWRIGNVRFVSGWDISYYRFDTRLSGLLVGATLAGLIRSGAMRPPVDWLVWLAPVPVAALLLVPMEWGDKVLLSWGCTLVELAAAVVILAVLFRPVGLVRALGHPLLAGLGKLSYGFYLWHYPVIRWLRPEMDWPGVLVVGFAASLGLAWLSYVTVERLARQRRRRPEAMRS